jgi:hypothetical protein
VKINKDSIEFNDHLTITFKRTLRIPDDKKTYPLPPGMGNFPIFKIADYLDKIPEEWLAVMTPEETKTAVFMPMYQKEAMWVSFHGTYWCPAAISMAIGKVNVITGEEWDANSLSEDPQNYMVAPRQPWIDGIKSGENVIRQFVSMPMGQGYTVEGQVTGEEKYGGIQLVVFEPKEIPKDPSWEYFSRSGAASQDGWWPSPFFAVISNGWQGVTCASGCCINVDPVSYGFPAYSPTTVYNSMAKGEKILYASQSVRSNSRVVSGSTGMGLTPDLACDDQGAPKTMGLAAGGKMKQRLYPDDEGIDFWNQETPSKIFIHICNSVLFEEITGMAAPPSPVDAKAYTRAGYPWFDIYDEKLGDLTAQEALKDVKSINEMDKTEDKGFNVYENDVITYTHKDNQKVWTP